MNKSYWYRQYRQAGLAAREAYTLATIQTTCIPIGSISHGTMRPEDLIPDFLDELWRLDSATAARLESEYPEVIDWLEDTDEEQPESTEYLLEELFDALDALAPSYFYFGSHPGDGADYGFWLCECIPDEFDEDANAPNNS